MDPKSGSANHHRRTLRGIAMLLTAVMPALIGGQLRADALWHFPEENYPDVTNLLQPYGINNVAYEYDGQSFKVPDVSGTGAPVDITASFVRDTGAFKFSFGVLPTSAVTGIDPATDYRNWVITALASPQTMVIFDNRVYTAAKACDPANLLSSCQNSFSGIPVDSDWFFFLIPNNTLAAFNADPDAFFDNPGGYTTRLPLFSYTPANPGGLDQMLSFVGNGISLFTFEDSARDLGHSDGDFTDIAFQLDLSFTVSESQEIVTQAPLPGVLLLMLWGLLAIPLALARRSFNLRTS